MSHYNFETPGHVRLRVDNKSGEVRLRARPGSTTDVEVTGTGSSGQELEGGTRVEHQRDEGGSVHTVVVEVPSPQGFMRSLATWGASVTVRVNLPEGAEIQVSTAAGDIGAEGAYGEARLGTASGDISVDRVSGDLSASTASGEIKASLVEGKTELTTASGDVVCDLLHGPARIRTASGDVAVREAHAHLSTQTASGDVRVGELRDGCQLQTASGDQELERAVSGHAQLQTMSGDLVVGVPRGTDVAVDAETMTGNLSSEIELSTEPPGNEPTGLAGAGPGGHRLELKARTVTGDLVIKRVP